MSTTRLAVFSWCLYDFANTIFSMNIISTYFPLWVTIDQGGADIIYSLILSGSMLLVALSSPILGAMSDQWQRRMPFLIIWTLSCVLATAGIGLFDRLYWGLVLFFLANWFYQTALVFYNGLLPFIARPDSVGKVSGYGVAFGYLGAIVGLKLVEPFVSRGGRVACFVPTASLFLLFSLPCLLLVREPPPSQHILAGQGWGQLISSPFQRLRHTLREARLHRDVWLFLGASLLYLDVVHTVIAFMSIYTQRVIGFNDQELVNFLVIATIFAMLGSCLIGWLASYLGARKSLLSVLALWVGALLLATISQSKGLFWLVGPLVGIGMGGVWVTGRVMLIELAPPDRIGEFFGLYGFSGKLSSIIGPLVWGFTVQVFAGLGIHKYRLALLLLIFLLVAGMGLLSSIRDRAKALEAQ